MPLKYQIAHYPDISKGITDKVVDGENGKAELIENFIPTSERVLKTVDGFDYKYTREAIAPINFMARVGDDLVFTRSNQLYLLDEVAQTASLVSTPNSSTFFSESNHPIDADDITSYVESQDRLIVANEAGSIPMMIANAEWIQRHMGMSTTTGLRSIRAGLPEVNGTIIDNGSGSGSNWKYRFHYSIEYVINGVVHKISGPTVEHEALDVGVGVTISGFVTPTTAMRVDGTVAFIECFRTIHNGSTFHHIGNKSTTITNFTDNESDAAISTTGRSTVYDNQDADGKEPIPYYPAPQCTSVAMNGNTVYYLSPSETIGSDVYNYRNRFIQGAPNAFGSCDLDAYEILADDVMGGGSINGRMVIQTKSYIYRIEGISTQMGEGFIRPIIISRSIGCLSSNSVIETSVGLFFVGNTGVFISDGFKVQAADIGLTNFFTDLFDPSSENTKIYGAYDKRHEILYWIATDESSNDVMLVYSIVTGGFTLIRPATMESRCLYMDDFDLLRGEYDGNIYNHHEDARGFITPVYSGAGTLLRTKRYGIPFRFKSIIDGLGMSMVRKWGKKLNITFQSESDTCIGLKSNNDDGMVSKEMKEIRHFGSWVWRDENFFWGNPDTTWRRSATKTESRHFPKRGLRFRRKQVELYPARTTIFKSDLFGLATVVLNVLDPLIPRRYEITLNSGDDWPDDILDYSIVANGASALIEEVIAKKVVVYGTQFTESAVAEWEIVGINKNQQVELHSYSFMFAPLKEMGDNYQKEDSGSNE